MWPMTHFISYPRRSNGRQGISRRKIEVKTAQVDANQAIALWLSGRKAFPHSLGREQTILMGCNRPVADVQPMSATNR